jgi:hypothetical protein
MKPEHLVALQNVCKTQDDLQKIWDNPAVFKFNDKFQIWVTMCVAEEGNEPHKELVWTACVRLADPKRRKFKASAVWTAHERLRARAILFDQLAEVGQELGEEEFNSTKAMHLNKKLTPEERGIVLKPHILGH